MSEVRSGVPHTSVLGPLLFLTYINNLSHKVESVIKLFADDTKLYAHISPTNDSSLQDDLNKLLE